LRTRSVGQVTGRRGYRTEDRELKALMPVERTDADPLPPGGEGESGGGPAARARPIGRWCIVGNLPIPAYMRERSTMVPAFHLANTDAVAWLQKLRPGSADLLITDPPYESLEKHRAVGTTTRLKRSKASSNAWFAIFPNARFPELFAAAYRVLKKDAHFYLFCDPETMFVAKPLGEAAGFKFWKPLIWDKRTIGMGYHYRARYENILFFEKGKRRLNDLGVPDVISVPRVRRGYPSEKPVELGDVLVRQSSAPGDLVLDPFAGSAAFGVAAVLAGRDFAGADISKEAIALARTRLLEAGARPKSWASTNQTDTIGNGEAA
jgi:site-specific DNA-methyltransferase (adenine-specific)